MEACSLVLQSTFPSAGSATTQHKPSVTNLQPPKRLPAALRLSQEGLTHATLLRRRSHPSDQLSFPLPVHLKKGQFPRLWHLTHFTILFLSFLSINLRNFDSFQVSRDCKSPSADSLLGYTSSRALHTATTLCHLETESRIKTRRPIRFGFVLCQSASSSPSTSHPIPSVDRNSNIRSHGWFRI